MNSTTRTVDIDLPADEAFVLVREAAQPLKFREKAAKPEKGMVVWSRGFTLSSNPQDCTARIEPSGDGASTITYKASVMALFDPFGFTRETADRFLHQLEAHVAARETGLPPEPPPPARIGLIVNLVVLGLVMVFLGGLMLCAIVPIIADAM